jgi:hypothetical protein
MPILRRFLTAVFLVGGFLIGCDGSDPRPEQSGPAQYPEQDAQTPSDWEVWLVDQSDSAEEGGFGGMLYIWDGADLEGIVAGVGTDAPEPSERIDLAGSTATLCREETGSNPVRPHMLLFNPDGSHASLAFVGSGHVAILEASTRTPVACFRMSPGAGGAQQAHAAFPTADGRHLLVANQNGKLLERIDTDWAGGTFEHNTAATLDLAQGRTPSGALREDPELRPDNAPICPVIDGSGRLSWVTLRGGGLFVVDVRATPMEIVAEYDRYTVKGNGCGGVEADGAMFVNSGGAPVNLGGEPHPHLQLHGFDVYRFPVDGYDPATGPNRPAPQVIFSADGERDSHGMVAVDGHLWVMDRHADVAEIFAIETGEHVATIELNGPLTINAAPDLVDRSPDGALLLVALRGPTPLTGDPHNATGESPGLGLIRVLGGGSSGELAAIARITNLRNGTEFADPHAVRVRRR